MSNVHITKPHKNITTDKLNVNPLLIGKEVRLIFRWLEVVCSLSPPDNFEPSENQATKKWKQVFTPPPRETQAGEYEVIVPSFSQLCPGWGLIQITGAKLLSGTQLLGLSMLCCAVLCCAVLCCAVMCVLYCAVCCVCCAVPCCVCFAVLCVLCVLCCAVLCCGQPVD